MAPAAAAGRKPFVGGNWKSNGSLESGKALIEALKGGVVAYKYKVDVVVCPIAPQLDFALKALKRTPIQVCAQDCSKTGEGAFTGEITAGQIKDFGINWTLVGHSERRTKYGDDDAACAAKVEKALEAKLGVIFCIGEQLEEREKGETDAVNKRMLDAVIPKIKDWSKVVVAYEPVWAIGTGKVATPEQAQETQAAVRKMLPADVQATVRILYGGSVTPDNCQELIKKEDIDGFLVGGASLKPSFTDIITACVPPLVLKKPVFVKISSVEPEMKGLNFFAKVLEVNKEDGITSVKVGDETGSVTLRVLVADKALACEVGKIMRIQNARVVMVKGFMNVQIDKWAALKPEDAVVGEVNTKKDMSAIEFELK